MLWRIADILFEADWRQNSAMEYSEQAYSQSQQPKITILQTVQRNLTYLGIGLNPTNKQQMFNWKILIDLLVLTAAIIWILLYILNDAETFTEYTSSIYLCTSFILIILMLSITIVNSTELYQIINDCECLINIREYRSVCLKMKVMFLFSLHPFSPEIF